MIRLWQLGYTQSHLLKWMGLFIQQGTAQKPVLAYYSASPSKLQTYTRCLQNTSGTTHNTITAQFLPITTALLFCAVLTPGLDLLFCVPACCYFAEKCCTQKTRRNPAGVTASCRVKRLANSGAPWAGACRALLQQPTCPFLQRRRSRPVQEEILNSCFSLGCVTFQMLCYGKKHTADHIVIGQALCRKTIVELLIGEPCWQPPKRAARGNDMGLLTSYMRQMLNRN